MHRLALLAASALSLVSAAHAETGFDFARTPGRLPKNVVPELYHIDLVPDLAKLTLSGTETIQISVTSPAATITLNQNGLTLVSASLDHGGAASITQDNAAQLATLTFKAPIGVGRHTLTIAYRGPIPNSPAGLYYDDYKTPTGQTRRMLVTQFESTDARDMFPGWDEPAFKARFELSVVLPNNFTAVSNMPVAASTAYAPGLTRVQFKITPRMSTYLLALVAGEMEAVRGRAAGTDIAVYTPTGEAALGDYALSVERNVLPFYNSYFGVKYPLPKLDMIAIPGNFDAGAMENWGAITYADESLLFDPKSSDAATRELIHTDVAHEMAHQWSGDLVTMAWWDNTWLNEGFATWMEFKATDKFNPSWQIWPRQHSAREQAMGGDAHPTTHPVQIPIPDDSAIATAFDQISYQKGEQVIRMIEDWIGEDTFRDGMRSYMKAHQYSNTTSADLWAALSKAANKDVTRVTAGFIEQPGIPLVKVARDCGASPHLTLTQDRFTVNDPHPAALRWNIPVTLAAPGETPVKLLLGTAPVTVALKSCDEPVKANYGEAGYYRTQYDAASQATLAANFNKFDPADRANLLGDQFAMFVAGRAPLADYLNMLPRLAGETHIAVWEETLARLARLDTLARGTPQRVALRAYARRLLRPEFERLGWDAKPGESFLDTSLRPDLIAALGTAEDPDIQAEAQRRFDAFVLNPASLAPSLRGPVTQIIGHTANQATYDRLRKLGDAALNSEEKLRYYTAMAAAGDPALIRQTVAFLSTHAVPNGRIVEIVAVAAQGSDNPDLVFKLVQQNQSQIRPLLAGFSPTYLLPAAASGSLDPATGAALMADPATTANTGNKTVGLKLVDAINAGAALRAAALPELAAWLKGKS